MGGSSRRRVFCRAGQWTNVIWIAGVLFYRKYTVDTHGVRADARRYGVGIPPYWPSSFTGRDTFGIYPWEVYMRIDIKTAVDTWVDITY